MSTKTVRALRAVVQTVEATGGVIQLNGRIYGCVADQDWLDLADAAVAAKQALAEEHGIQEPLTVIEETLTQD